MTRGDLPASELRSTPPAPLAAVGVVLPVRDEELLLGAALRALSRAMRHPGLAGTTVRVAVVLDGCADRSGEIATGIAREIRSGVWDHRLTVLEADGRNVGSARRAGLHQVLEDLDGLDIDGIWLATTDADSRVPPSWLAHQAGHRACGVEAWAGTVVVDDWTDRPMRLEAMFAEHYRTPRHGGHVHGASMGFDTSAYLRAGGFPAVTAEDHGLWRLLGEIGARRVHDPGCPVATSGRRRARAPDGFAGALDQIERRLDQELEDAD